MKIRQTNIHKISELKETEKYSFQKAIEMAIKQGKKVRVWRQE